MSKAILLVTSGLREPDLSTGYLAGAIIVLIIFGYLLYTLIKPEKF